MAPKPPPKAELKTFLASGTIRKIEAAERTATIQHEEVRDTDGKVYMPAMTMPFTVMNATELDGLQSGDGVVFRLNVSEKDSWIDKLKKAPAPPPAITNAPPSQPFVRIGPSVPELKVGDLLPDYTFTNELGQAVRLDKLKGEVLALTLIYTRCPLPEMCPRMSEHFSEAYKQLTANSAAPKNWRLLSLSFDPEFDTPSMLKAYAQRYKYDPKKWSFVTGSTADVAEFGDRLNMSLALRDGVWDHKLRTLVVDAQGRVRKIFVGNQWTPSELAEEIVKAAT